MDLVFEFIPNFVPKHLNRIVMNTKETNKPLQALSEEELDEVQGGSGNLTITVFCCYKCNKKFTSKRRFEAHLRNGH